MSDRKQSPMEYTASATQKREDTQKALTQLKKENYWKDLNKEVALEKDWRKTEAEEQRLGRGTQEGYPEEYFTGGSMSELTVLPGSLGNMATQLAFDALAASDPKLAVLSLGIGMGSKVPSMLKRRKHLKSSVTDSDVKALERMEDMMDKLSPLGMRSEVKEGIKWGENWNKHPEVLKRRIDYEHKVGFDLANEINDVQENLNNLGNLAKSRSKWWKKGKLTRGERGEIRNLKHQIYKLRDRREGVLKNLNQLENPEKFLYKGGDVKFYDFERIPVSKGAMGITYDNSSIWSTARDMEFSTSLLSSLKNIEIDASKKLTSPPKANYLDVGAETGLHEFAHSTRGGYHAYDKDLILNAYKKGPVGKKLDTDIDLDSAWKGGWVMENKSMSNKEFSKNIDFDRIVVAGLEKPTEIYARIQELRHKMGWKTHSDIPKNFKMTDKLNKDLLKDRNASYQDLLNIINPDDIGKLMKDLSATEPRNNNIENALNSLEGIA